MNKNKSSRGFSYYNFEDRGGHKCSIQKSSLATEDCIWLGSDDIGLKHFIPNIGWQDVKLETTHEYECYIANNRMHLTIDNVKQLLPILQKFVETGEI